MIDIEAYLKTLDNDLNDISEEDCKRLVDTLINDENEAIAGYDRAIQLFENCTLPFAQDLVKVCKKIKADEYQHIEDLRGTKPYEYDIIEKINNHI